MNCIAFRPLAVSASAAVKAPFTLISLSRNFHTSNPLMDRKILVCSIGNPGPYLNTRHSAGHTITSLLSETLSLPPFSRSKSHSGDLSSPAPGDDPTFTLWQSKSLMNVSGKGVKNAWTAFTAGLDPEEQKRAVLVVVHDEMEVKLGAVKVKRTGSATGHNGITSVMGALGTKDFIRIGVGISRPESRDSQVVSDYVLGKFTPKESRAIKEKSLPLVLQKLREIAAES